MLSFKDLQELLEPKAAGEKRFKDKHVVGIVDHPLNDAETLKGTKKSPGKKKRIADSEEGKDAAVYEELEQDDLNDLMYYALDEGLDFHELTEEHLDELIGGLIKKGIKKVGGAIKNRVTTSGRAERLKKKATAMQKKIKDTASIVKSKKTISKIKNKNQMRKRKLNNSYEENITKCKCENCGCEDCECETNEESLRATYGESWKAVMYATKQAMNESVIDKVKEIASKKSAAKIDGVMVDSFTASAISQIYDKVNDANKKKMEKLPIVKLATLAMKMMQKNEYVPEEADLDEELDEGKLFNDPRFLSQTEKDKEAFTKSWEKHKKMHKLRHPDDLKKGTTISDKIRDMIYKDADAFKKEEADLDEASNGLPPHLAKFLDKKGNLNPDAAKRMAKGKSKKDVASRTKDVTPKGYGPNEELEESAAGIAKLKKAYEPMRDKKISLDNAKKLSAIMDKFADNKAMLIKLVKADIPFVTQSAVTKLITKHNMKGAEINKMMKEGNAFGMALKAAKEKGDKTFVVAGKTYEVYESVDLDEAVNFSATDMKLKDGSTVKVSKDDAAALNNLYKSLNPANTKTMLAKFMQDKKSNSEILAFAKQAM